MNDLVSVIVPVYNAEKYLERCIESIGKQTYTNLEIILVDDGSTDKSTAICDEYSQRDPRIKVFHKQNGGAGMARNTGLENANGKYVVFVDSDDYIDITTIEKCVENIKKYNSDLVMFGRFNQTADGQIKPKTVPKDKLYFENEEVISDILSGLFTHKRGVGISCWGKMFDLDVIKSNALKFYSERQLLSEDAFFMLHVFVHIKSVAVIPENLYFYCENDASLSRKYNEGHQARCDNFLKESTRLCKDLGYSTAVSLNLSARYLMHTLSGMKRIITSNLFAAAKREELKSVFHNQTLHSVLTADVLNLLNSSSRLFWRFFKMRLFNVCYLLLLYKSYR